MSRAFCLILLLLGHPSVVVWGEAEPPLSWPEVDHSLERYCSECHCSETAEADLVLTDINQQTNLSANPEKWMGVIQALRSHYMPHPDGRKMPQSRRKPLIDALQLELAHLAKDYDSTSASIRRLNRVEFSNTLNDLFLVEQDWADSLPADDAGYGFDNIAAALSFSPLLLERYFDVASRVSAVAIPQRMAAEQWSHSSADFSGGYASSRSRTIASSGAKNAANHRVFFPGNGRYTLSLELSADQAGDETARAELWLDGQRIGESEVQAKRGETPDTVTHSVSIEMSGDHQLEIRLLKDFYRETESGKEDRNLIFHRVRIDGPYQSPDDLKSPFLEHHFGGSPEGLSLDLLKDGIHRFGSRAFRRPLTDEESTALWKVFQANSRGHDFERDVRNGLYAVIDAVLTTPSFLFRVEGSSESYQADSFALASWLSYFLWSSMPDDRLFDLARRQQLQANLESEVLRMLADPKAVALADNFAGQWWRFRDLANHLPDQAVYPGANQQLLRAMQEETKRFFIYVLEHDRSLIDFLSADYTFLNEQLAQHYGIDGVAGQQFRKVSLEGSLRRGVWSQGGILTVTSHPNYTSPVLRGQWILENLIGLAPPPPPDNIPSLPNTDGNPAPSDLRASLALHREDSDCASCHDIMDPIGLALESFDGVGGLRSVAERKMLSTETLFDGAEIGDPIQLAHYLEAQRSDDFTRNLGQKLSIYAAGRGLDWRDEAALQRIAEYTRDQEYRFSGLIQAVVNEFAPTPKTTALSAVE